MAITKCLIDDRCRKEYIFPTLLNWVERGDILPQKLLYANHIGAFRYSELTKSGIHQRVYASFPINFSGSELNKYFRHNLENMIGANLIKQKRMGIFILGAGLGTRESEMVRWLIYNFPEIESIRIWLLDISEEMMTKSIETFKRIDDDRLDIRGFILDFEESLAEIASVRADIGQEIPCLFLLFGNTIANLDQKVFLQTISNYMFSGDVLVMEYLLADENTYFELIKNNIIEDSRFGSVVKEYDPKQDNRFEFVVSPLRILGISIVPECLKLYRKCIAGKGISYVYVYELREQDLETLVQLGLSKSLYSGWQLPVLKIERLLSDYVASISRSSFKMPSMFQLDYGIQDGFTFIYSLMQKECSEGVIQLHIENQIDPQLLQLVFHPENQVIYLNDHSMRCTPKQFFLLMATAKFPQETATLECGPEHIFEEFNRLFTQWSEAHSNIDYRTEGVLDNLINLQPSEQAVFVSKGLRDIENKIRRGEAPVFHALLSRLPHRGQWFLNFPKSCISVMES